jgi:outer membrane protein assembly factor BamB
MTSLHRLLLAACIACAGASSLAINGPLPLSWRWFAKTSYAPHSQPVLSDGTLYVGVGRRVYALDAATGNQKWMFPAGEEPAGEFAASPVIVGDKVIAANTNNFVYAINKATGTTAWSYMMGSTTARSLVASDKAVYLFTADDRIVGLETENGGRLWTSDYQVEGNVAGDPIISEGHLVFFLTSGKLLGLSAAAKKVDWQIPVQSVNREGGPVAFGQSVYVVSGSQVAQVNPRTGRTGWVIPFPEKLAAGVAITDKAGAVCTENGKVYTFSLAGRLTSKQPLDLNGYIGGSPQAAGSNVLIRMRGGSIVLIDPTRGSGEAIWEYTTLPVPGTTRRSSGGSGSPATIDYVAIQGALAIAPNALYGLAEDGSVFAWGGELGVDEIGPSISMLAPAMGAVMWGQPDTDFYFKLEDQQTGVMSKSIRVTMNNKDMKFEYLPGKGALYARIRASGSKEPGANPPLGDGRKTITVACTDWAGNISEKTFTVVIDNTLFDRRTPPPSGNTGGRGGGGRGGGGGGGSAGGR